MSAMKNEPSSPVCPPALYGTTWTVMFGRRSLWIAAEDCPDGEQVEEPDLDVLLARLLVIASRR